ncbi:MAG: response regulator transcription factor [Candidatus Brocadiales bacterium]|nr:response regulator transcription factor [Candidatus Brocadiales bacterium]
MSNTVRILISDDDDETLLLPIIDLLHIEGYECNYITDAMTVIEILKCVKFDLLIAYVNMDGSSALEIIKGLPDDAKELPIILVSDVPLSEAQMKFLEPSVMACLNKPFSFEELLKHVKCSIEDKVYN